MEQHEHIYTIQQYLKGKVADYTISDNVIESVLFDREIEKDLPAAEVEIKFKRLCYADLLKYIYLQPTTTKSYSVANGTWSQKEGATTLSESDRKRLLGIIRRIYGMYDEPLDIPIEGSSIRMVSHGMRTWGQFRRR